MFLNQQYNREGFQDFLNGFLPDDFLGNIQDLIIDSRFKIITAGQVLGECESLGIKIIELEHKKDRDPRVSLATEAFRLMADNWIKKALVVFKSTSSENWRLSYMTMSFEVNDKNKVSQSFSNPRRKSFYLGSNAKIATPYSFLITKGRIADIADLESRFDVEVVTREFFDNYKTLFDKLTSYLKKDKAFNVFAAHNQIKLEDFSKKLLGQIVFIYFLQRKGWLGAKKEDHVYEGNLNFVRDLFVKCEKDGGNYFNDVLEHLFYDALNNEPEKASSFYREFFDCQIPFLNGGLFEPLNKYDWEKSFLHIPNTLFSNKDKTGILDVFDLYNFTIDENSAIDQEVSVDPEMLGKVFERLLDTNKETGSFYTPREIVSYMVKQSLIQYLVTHVDVKRELIEDLVNNHDLRESEIGNSDFQEIESKLKTIKIIDPAVGSGAFPVGILQEITVIRSICQANVSNKPKNSYEIKREILENNIYGVDIDHGAIDIARLRFWLSLVVDADLMDIEPLPNLDFKLTAANTLSKLDGESGLWDEEDLLKQMKDLREKYFRARTKNTKEKIQKDFDKLIKKSNNLLATDRQKQIATYNPFSSSKVSQFFDSEFMFGVSKFDIVLANPPYIDSEGMVKTGQQELREKIQKTYKWTKGNWDIYIAFFELGISLTSESGVLSYITPDKWISKPFGEELRKGIINNIFAILKSGRGIFDSAKVDSIITFISKKEVPDIKIIDYVNNDFITNKIVDKKKIPPPYSLDYLFSKNSLLLEKIDILPGKISDLGICENACATSDAYKIQPLIKDDNADEYDESTHYKIINTGTIGRYYSRWGKKEMTYLKNKYKKPIIRRKKFEAVFPNSYGKKASLQKIIIKGLNLLDCCLDCDGSVIPGKTTLIVSNKNLDNLKFLLVLLNNPIAIFYIKEKYPASSYNQGTTFTKDMINNFPIPNISDSNRNEIIKIANNILAITSSEDFKGQDDDFALINVFEDRLNELFAGLYALSDAEKLLVYGDA